MNQKIEALSENQVQPPTANQVRSSPVFSDTTTNPIDALNQVKPVPKTQAVPESPEPEVVEAQFLAHSGENNVIADLEAKSSKITRVISKVISIGLGAQSLYHLYQSIFFVLVEAPLIEQKFSLGLIDHENIILLIAKASIELFSALAGIFIAFKLSRSTQTSENTAHLVIAVIVFIANLLLIDFFRSISSEFILLNSNQAIASYVSTLSARLSLMTVF
jgi:hypothetical protein